MVLFQMPTKCQGLSGLNMSKYKLKYNWDKKLRKIKK